MSDNIEMIDSDLSLSDLDQRIEMTTTVPPDMTGESVSIVTTWEL